MSHLNLEIAGSLAEYREKNRKGDRGIVPFGSYIYDTYFFRKQKKRLPQRNAVHILTLTDQQNI